MSGHITRMSRGSRVGSSASRPSSTSRSTSTWRAGPWQLCTWTERSSARSDSAVMAGRRWPRYRTAASPAGCRDARAPGRNSSRPWQAGRLRCNSRRSRPRVASSGCFARAVALVVAAGDHPALVGQRGPQIGAGVRQPQVHVVVRRRGPPAVRCRWRAAGCGRTATAVRAGRRPRSRSCTRVLACRTCGGSIAIVATRRRHSSRLPGEVVIEALPVTAAVTVEPVGQQLRALAGVGGEQAGQPPGHGVAAALPQVLLHRVGFAVAEVGGQRPAPGLVERWRR